MIERELPFAFSICGLRRLGSQGSGASEDAFTELSYRVSPCICADWRLGSLIVRELSEQKTLTRVTHVASMAHVEFPGNPSAPAIVFLLISHARACLRGSLQRIGRTLPSVSPRARSALSSNFFAALSSYARSSSPLKDSRLLSNHTGRPFKHPVPKGLSS